MKTLSVHSHFVWKTLRYGDEFIHETYLYHIIRKDHRHNFSPYFYHMYLGYYSPSGALSRLLAFVPQFGSVIAIGLVFWKVGLIETVFLQTFAFVAFNKVCTSQVIHSSFSIIAIECFVIYCSSNDIVG